MVWLEAVLRSSLALAATALLWSVLSSRWGRRLVGARVRHRVLTVGMVATFLVVGLSAASVRVPALPAPDPAIATVEPGTAIDAEEGVPAGVVRAGEGWRRGADPVSPGALPVTTGAFLLWALGALVMLGRILWAERRIGEIVRASEAAPAQLRDQLSTLGRGLDVELRSTREVASAVVTRGRAARWVVLLPSAFTAWPAPRLRLVLLHELGHIHRRDPVWLRAALGLRALLFFHPLAWWLVARLRSEAELATDEWVLETAGTQPSSYAEVLLRAAAGDSRTDAAFAMASGPSLERRILTLVDPAMARRDLPGPAGRALSFLLLSLLVILGCADRGSSEPSKRPAATAEAEEPASSKAIGELFARWVADPRVTAVQAVALDGATGRLRLVRSQRRGETATESLSRVPPGSTLKPLLVAAALDAGMDVDETFEIERELKLPGAKPIRDLGEPGPLDLSGVIARSSNVGAARVVLATPGGLVRDLLGNLAFVEAPSEIPRHLGEHDGRGVRAAALGEGVRVHPVTLAAAYAALVNGGEWVEPTLDGGGSRRRVVRPETASAVQAMLRGAVWRDDGTGHRARRAGPGAAGKTGTVVSGAERRALFTGWVEREGEALVVHVDFEVHGEAERAFGGALAAPAFAELARVLSSQESH